MDMTHSNVYVAESTIRGGGRGVFARRDLRVGDYVCYYDGVDVSIGDLNGYVADYEYFMANPDGGTRVGYRDPVNVDGVGQIINDGAILRLTDDMRNDNGLYCLSNKTIHKALAVYGKVSTAIANVSFCTAKKRRMKLYATKAIKKDEELFITYGTNYWIQCTLLTTDEPFTKLSCMGLCDPLYVDQANNKVIAYGSTYDPILFLTNVLSIRLDGNIVRHFGLVGASPITIVGYLINLIQ